MKILATADLHGGGLTKLDLSGCDIVLLAGDICPDRTLTDGKWTYEGFVSKLRWLEGIFIPWCERHPNVDFAITLGNRDKFILEKPVAEIAWPQNVHCLIDEQVEIRGLKIYGTPWVQIKNERLAAGLPGNGVYELPPEELKQKFASIPDGLDILISHATPANTDTEIDLGTNAAGETVRYGATALTDAIRRAKPRVAICGHIHAMSHRVAHLEEEVGCEIVNVSRTVRNDRKGVLGGVKPRTIEVGFDESGEPSFSLFDRELDGCRFRPVFSEFGKPYEPFDGNPFEDPDWDCHMFWALEAWLLNPETTNYDAIERMGRSRIAKGECCKAIAEVNAEEWLKVLAAAMEAVGEERDDQADKLDPEYELLHPVPRYRDLDWREFFKGPGIALSYRFYKGEEANPYDKDEDFDRHCFWNFERDIASNSKLQYRCLQCAIGDDRKAIDEGWLRDIKASAFDKAMLLVGKRHMSELGSRDVGDDVRWHRYFKDEECPLTEPKFKFFERGKECIWEPGSNEALFWQGEKVISEWTNEHFNDMYYVYAEKARQKWCKGEGGARTIMEAFMGEMIFEIVARFVTSLEENDRNDYFKPVTSARKLVAWHDARARKGLERKGVSNEK